MLGQKKQAPSFKLRAQPWLEVELVMGSQPSILATAIDLLRKLCVNEAQVLRQVCTQGIGPFFSWAIIVALCTHYLQAWRTLLGMRSTRDKADARWCNCTNSGIP